MVRPLSFTSVTECPKVSCDRQGGVLGGPESFDGLQSQGSAQQSSRTRPTWRWLARIEPKEARPGYGSPGQVALKHRIIASKHRYSPSSAAQTGWQDRRRTVVSTDDDLHRPELVAQRSDAVRPLASAHSGK